MAGPETGRLFRYIRTMAANSYNSRATAAQRREVLRLADDGMSVRRIASEVFGDGRLRGRVERILKGRTREMPTDPLDIHRLSSLEVLKLFFERRVAEMPKPATLGSEELLGYGLRPANFLMLDTCLSIRPAETSLVQA